METTNPSNRPSKVKVILGVIVILIGVSLLLNHLNIFQVDLFHILFAWPNILIIIGIVKLNEKKSSTSGLILIMIGVFFMLPRFIDFSFNFIGILWPLLIILAGLLIVFKTPKIKQIHTDCFKEKWDNCSSSGNTTNGKFSEVNIFGGTQRNFSGQTIRKGEALNIFGGTKLDLKGAFLENDYFEMEIVCIFGGLQLILPDDWHVRVEVVSIFGGFADKRSVKNIQHDTQKVVVIKGLTLFGGGEIKSFD